MATPGYVKYVQSRLLARVEPDKYSSLQDETARVLGAQATIQRKYIAGGNVAQNALECDPG